LELVGLPFGQAKAAARVAELTVKGASPAIEKLVLLFFPAGNAREWTLKISNSKVRNDIMNVDAQ